MDAISPLIRLEPDTVPYSFLAFRWTFDIALRQAHHDSGATFVMVFSFSIDDLARSTTPVTIYDVGSRLCNVCKGKLPLSGGRLLQLGREAIMVFLKDADLWEPSPSDRTGEAPRRPTLRPPRPLKDDTILF